MAFTPDSRVLVSVNDEPERPGVPGEARFWDPATGRPVGPGAWKLGDVHFNAIAFSPDGRRLAVSSYRLGEPGADQIELRDPASESGRVVLTLGAHNASVQGLQFSPDGTLLVSAG